MKRGFHYRGFTLIETLLVITLTGIMMAGMTQLFVGTMRHSHEPVMRQKALSGAKAIMDEILNKSWDDLTPLGGGCVATGTGRCPSGVLAAGPGTEEVGRAEFDDIDDYDSIRNQSPPHDALDLPMAGYTAFSLSVFVDQPGPWNGIPGGDVKRIRVQVATPTQETISLTAYRVNF